MSDPTPDQKPSGPTVSYSGNSNKAKAEAAAEENPKIASVVTGAAMERKEPLHRKFMSAYAGDNAKSVGSYLLWDVLVPTSKNLISDLVTQGINRALYGTSRPAGGGVSTVLGSRGYGNYFNGGNANRGTQQQQPMGPQMSQQARAQHAFGEIILTSRSDGEMVLDAMRDRIEQYGNVSVTALYSLAGLTSDWTDNKYGWTNLARASVQQVPQGFLLDLPRPEVLK